VKLTRVFVIALLLSGAVYGQTPASGDAGPVIVRMTVDKQFVPNQLTITAGQTVQWVNEDPLHNHNASDDPDIDEEHRIARLPKGAKPFDSGVLTPGSRWSYRFTAPGRYHYVCVPHLPGMVADIIVKPQ
jgi:plastocyanin